MSFLNPSVTSDSCVNRRLSTSRCKNQALI